MKKTAIAPANIAFIKYWGKKDEKLKLPENGSISMNLSGLTTTTTVEFSEKYKKDEIVINDEKESNIDSKAVAHLNRIRKIAKINLKAKVVTFNNFPIGTGLSSSASGFAALTVAAVAAAELQLSEKQLSILARQGSGSACRSIPDGFVEWLDGDYSETSYSVFLYPPNYWDIFDVVALVSKERKDVGSTAGQKLAESSYFYKYRLSRMSKKISKLKAILKRKDFTALGQLAEEEALELHAIMLTSIPSLIYWTPGTLLIMKLIKKWRDEGLESYFTINTGQDVHILIREKDVKKLIKKLKNLDEVRKIIINKPAVGAHLIDKHLF